MREVARPRRRRWRVAATPPSPPPAIDPTRRRRRLATGRPRFPHPPEPASPASTASGAVSGIFLRPRPRDCRTGRNRAEPGRGGRHGRGRRLARGAVSVDVDGSVSSGGFMADGARWYLAPAARLARHSSGRAVSGAGLLLPPPPLQSQWTSYINRSHVAVLSR